MKIYFTAALYQKEKFGDKYKKIVDIIKSSRIDVFEDTTKVSLEEALDTTDSERVDYYKKVLKWIDRADLVVIEASFPSTLSIGHEISLAVEKNKPVIVLYQKGLEPTFLLGIKNDKIMWIEYTEETLEKKLAEAIEEARKKADVRFNFFVSPKILAYLDWVAQNKKLPRSVFLRDLIEKEMKKDKQYKGEK